MSEKKNELTEEDYYQLLKGKNRGCNYGDSYIVKTKKKIPKDSIILNDSVGLPGNMNDTYDVKIGPKNAKKRKDRGASIDPQLLQYLNRT